MKKVRVCCLVLSYYFMLLVVNQTNKSLDKISILIAFTCVHFFIHTVITCVASFKDVYVYTRVVPKLRRHVALFSQWKTQRNETRTT